MYSVDRLQKMKKAGKILRIASIVAAAVTAVVILLFILMPATNLQTDTGKYADGYNYYGWQLTFLGCGYPPVPILALFEESSTLAGDYVPNTWDFDFNICTFLGIILPVLGLIVCSTVSVKMKNRGKAVCEYCMAALLLFGGIMLINCAALSVNVATDMGAGTGFKNQYLLPAIEAGTYKTLFYPVFVFVVCLLTSLGKIGRGVFLMYQRKYALALKKTQQENSAC